MAKKAGKKAAEGYVELGLDKNPLVKALASAQTTFTSSLSTMSKQAANFGKSLGLGLGAAGLGGAGFGAALGALAKKGLGLEDAMAALAMQASMTNATYKELEATVNRMLPTLQKLAPVGWKEVAAMTAVGSVYNFTGKEMDKFLVRATALARLKGLDPVTAAEGLAKGIRKPTMAALTMFGIPELPAGPNVQMLIRPRLLEVADAAVEAAQATMALPSAQLKAVKKSVSDWFDALGEAGIEGVMDSIDKRKGGGVKPEGPAQRKARRAADRTGFWKGIGADALKITNIIAEVLTTPFPLQAKKIKDKYAALGGTQKEMLKELAPALLPPVLQPMAMKRGMQRLADEAKRVDYIATSGRVLEALPSAEELRGRSLRTENIVQGIGDAREGANQAIYGLGPEDRAARHGDYSPRSLIMSDAEHKRALESREALDVLREIRDKMPEPGTSPTRIEPAGVGLVEPFS